MLVLGRKPILKITWVLLFLFCALALFIYLNLRSYRAFTHEDLVAKVICSPAPRGQLYDMSLRYTPIVKDKLREERVYLLNGNQWLIEGEILKWKPVFNILGLNTLYKITRISGRYLFTNQQNSPAQTMYTLNGGTDYLWIMLHRLQNFFPFIEAVYGNGAYTFPDRKASFGVYVTTSGFIIKKNPRFPQGVESLALGLTPKSRVK